MTISPRFHRAQREPCDGGIKALCFLVGTGDVQTVGA